MSMLAAAVQSGEANVPTPRPEKAAPARMIYSAQRDMLADQLQEMLEIDNPSQHEDDIMFVVDVAMKQFGVRLADELRQFKDRQMALAHSSGGIDEGGRHFAADPMIQQLAKYLRYREQLVTQ